MKNRKRIAECSELAEYQDGTLVHVGMVTGHNDGIDEDGFDHRKYFEAQKERGLYPQRIDGLRVTAVREHVSNGRDVKTHWRAFTEDLERILNDPESEYHKMAKEACLGLLRERKFNDIVKTKIPQFKFGGCQAELLINAGDRQFFADVGVWDHRSRNIPIAMEISYTSPQTKERISALSQSGTHVYNFDILERTRGQLKAGNEVNVQFYRELMLKKKFTFQEVTEVNTPLQAFYIGVAELKKAEEQRRAIERAGFFHEQEMMRIRERDKASLDQGWAREYEMRVAANGQALQRHAVSKEKEEQEDRTVGGRMKTWTGRVVSLADWQNLTEWERHGPNGRYWCGITKEWETQEAP